MKLEELSHNYLNWLLFYCVSLLVFIQFFSSLTILPLYALEVGGTEFDSGLQTTLFFVAAVVMRFYFGPLADKKGRKLPILIGVVAFATAPLLFLLSQSVWSLALARIYQAIGLAAFFSSGSSLVADMAPEGKMGLCMGGYRMTNTAAVLVGPLLAMFVINSAGYDTWFKISLAIGLAAILLMLLVKTPQVVNTGAFQSIDRLTSVFKNRDLWPVYMGLSLVALGYGSLITFASVYIAQTTTVPNPGIYFTYFAAAGLTASLFIGYLSDRFERAQIAWPVVLFVGLSISTLYFLPTVPQVLVVSGIFGGIGFSGGLLALTTWLVDAATLETRATALAMQDTTIDLSVAISSLLFGIASGLIGMQISFTVLGMLILFVAGSFFIRTAFRTKDPAHD